LCFCASQRTVMVVSKDAGSRGRRERLVGFPGRPLIGSENFHESGADTKQADPPNGKLPWR